MVYIMPDFLTQVEGNMRKSKFEMPGKAYRLVADFHFLNKGNCLTVWYKKIKLCNTTWLQIHTWKILF